MKYHHATDNFDSPTATTENLHGYPLLKSNTFLTTL